MQDQTPVVPKPEPPKKPTKPRDPTAASRTWAIALVVSAVFLLAAAGVVVWLVLTRSTATPVGNIAPSDPAYGVKNVSFVLPADFPANYVPHDQSKVGESFVFYDDEPAGCSLVLGVLPSSATKPPQDVVVERLAAAYAPGVTTTQTTLGERFVVKDADGSREYSFESVDTEQGVNVSAVGFTGRQQTTQFKAFGTQVAALGYGCKTDAAADKKAEVATLAARITIKTER